MRRCIIYCCLVCWAMFFYARLVSAQVFVSFAQPPLPAKDSLAYKRWQLGTPFGDLCNALVESDQWKHIKAVSHKGPPGNENICEHFQTWNKLETCVACFIGTVRLTSLIFTCQRGTLKESQWDARLAACHHLPSTDKWLDEEADVEITRTYVMGEPFAVQYCIRRIGKGL